MSHRRIIDDRHRALGCALIVCRRVIRPPRPSFLAPPIALALVLFAGTFAATSAIRPAPPARSLYSGRACGHFDCPAARPSRPRRDACGSAFCPRPPAHGRMNRAASSPRSAGSRASRLCFADADLPSLKPKFLAC